MVTPEENTMFVFHRSAAAVLLPLALLLAVVLWSNADHVGVRHQESQVTASNDRAAPEH
jgi:hypothetical protein